MKQCWATKIVSTTSIVVYSKDLTYIKLTIEFGWVKAAWWIVINMLLIFISTCCCGGKFVVLLLSSPAAAKCCRFQKELEKTYKIKKRFIKSNRCPSFLCCFHEIKCNPSNRHDKQLLLAFKIRKYTTILFFLDVFSTKANRVPFRFNWPYK